MTATPSPSTIPASGNRFASEIVPAAGLRPQRASVCRTFTTRSGRIGRITPASARIFAPPSVWTTRPGMLVASFTVSIFSRRALPARRCRSRDRRPARRRPGRAADPVRLARPQAAQQLPDIRPAELLENGPLRGLDHVLAPLRAHQVTSHGAEVVGRRLDRHRVGAEAAHLAGLVGEPASVRAAGEGAEPGGGGGAGGGAGAPARGGAPADLDRTVEARYRAGGGDRVGDPGGRGALPAERDAPAAPVGAGHAPQGRMP